ncbi:MAG: nucleotidyltransferase domain-containing protein [Anaerolineae bacterium]
MVAPAYVSVLRHLCQALADGQVNWVLTGSLAFALQGLPIQPRDVDVLSTSPYALKLCKAI